MVASAIVPSTANVPRLTTPSPASVVADKLPPMVKVPLSVIPEALPLVSVKLPTTVDSAITNAVVPPSIVACATVPSLSLVVKVIAPVKALVVVSNAMVALFALVMNADVPEIARAPLSVILPVVAVADNVPSTVEAAKAKPTSLTNVTLPFVPLVVSAIVPSTANVPRLIVMSLTSVVADKLPPMVKVPLSVIAPPLVSVKSPTTVDSAITNAVVPPSIVASASVPSLSLVVNVTAPVKALVVVSNAMVALFALVMNADVPEIVRTPLSVILPVVAVADNVPAIEEVPKTRPPLPPIVTSPLVVVLVDILLRLFPA